MYEITLSSRIICPTGPKSNIISCSYAYTKNFPGLQLRLHHVVPLAFHRKFISLNIFRFNRVFWKCFWNCSSRNNTYEKKYKNNITNMNFIKTCRFAGFSPLFFHVRITWTKRMFFIATAPHVCFTTEFLIHESTDNPWLNMNIFHRLFHNTENFHCCYFWIHAGIFFLRSEFSSNETSIWLFSYLQTTSSMPCRVWRKNGGTCETLRCITRAKFQLFIDLNSHPFILITALIELLNYCAQYFWKTFGKLKLRYWGIRTRSP